MSDEFDIDRWSMTSDMLRFLRMGFLLMKELLFDNMLLPVSETGWVRGVYEDVCNGPYNHVTSQSLSQLRVSGETVRNRYFALAQVRHDAFSNLDLWPYVLRLVVMCRHEDQISSSLQS